jgi:hypothetical protein
VSTLSPIASFSTPSLWYSCRPFVDRVLEPADVKFVDELRHVTTDSGKGRAWIRWTLNERSLESYLHKLSVDHGVLASFYEDYAFIADEDRTSMLARLLVLRQHLSLEDVTLNPTYAGLKPTAMPPISTAVSLGVPPPHTHILTNQPFFFLNFMPSCIAGDAGGWFAILVVWDRDGFTRFEYHTGVSKWCIFLFWSILSTERQWWRWWRGRGWEWCRCSPSQF